MNDKKYTILLNDLSSIRARYVMVENCFFFHLKKLSWTQQSRRGYINLYTYTIILYTGVYTVVIYIPIGLYNILRYRCTIWVKRFPNDIGWLWNPRAHTMDRQQNNGNKLYIILLFFSPTRKPHTRFYCPTGHFSTMRDNMLSVKKII